MECLKLKPTYEELAQSFEKVDDLLVAEIDCTLNELADYKPAQYPTIRYGSYTLK